MKELGASNMVGAAQPLNPVIPISLQPAQMQTGYTHWISKLLDILRSVMEKHKKIFQDRNPNNWKKKQTKKTTRLSVSDGIVNAVCLMI